jgi:hypothetical protein
MSAVLDDLDLLLRNQDDVLTYQQASAFLTREVIRDRLRTERWRKTHRSVLLTSPEPATRAQRRWIAVLASGHDPQGRPRGLIGGRAALEVHGLKGFAGDEIDLVLHAEHRLHAAPDWVRVHRSRHLEPDDVAPDRRPPCTSAGRSCVDAARWADTDDEARALIAAAFRQGIATHADVAPIIKRLPKVRRAAFIAATVHDAARGAQAPGELAYLALSRREGFPEPTLRRRRAGTTDPDDYRGVDIVYDGYGLHIVVDAAGVTGVAATMGRVLRFPSRLVRGRPAEVARHVRGALLASGRRWRSA